MKEQELAEMLHLNLYLKRKEIHILNGDQITHLYLIGDTGYILNSMLSLNLLSIDRINNIDSIFNSQSDKIQDICNMHLHWSHSLMMLNALLWAAVVASCL